MGKCGFLVTQQLLNLYLFIVLITKQNAMQWGSFKRVKCWFVVVDCRLKSDFSHPEHLFSANHTAYEKKHYVCSGNTKSKGSHSAEKTMPIITMSFFTCKILVVLNGCKLYWKLLRHKTLEVQNNPNRGWWFPRSSKCTSGMKSFVILAISGFILQYLCKLIPARGGSLGITAKYLTLVLQKANTGSVHTNSKHMRWQRSQWSTLVLFNSIWRIKLRDVKIRIHCNEDVGYIGLWRKQWTANYELASNQAVNSNFLLLLKTTA